jgi:hypothetical protein
MVAVACWATVPFVSIPSLDSLDAGAVVQTAGLLVEVHTWDDGSETMVLVDPMSGDTVKVICRRAVKDQPSSYASIGDELKVQGEVFGLQVPRNLYTNSDKVVLLHRCEYVLTVDSLATCWQLFQGDDVSLRGVLLRTDDPDGLALRALSGDTQLTVRYRHQIDSGLLGTEVLSQGTLVFEGSSLQVVLLAELIQHPS